MAGRHGGAAVMMRPVSLPQYEGPLDLLLELVRRNELDIRNLPMAEVTRQFLEYLATAEKLDLDLDAEWFYMVSLLIQIKSRSLLPPAPEQDQADPREELVRQLLDRAQLAGAAAFLENQWAALGGWPAPPPPDSSLAANGEDNPGAHGSLTLLEVLQLAQRALATVAAAQDLAIPPAAVPMEEMLALLDRQLAELPAGGRLDFGDLWRKASSDQHRSALFLALLEAARSRRLDLEQDACFAPIWIRPSGQVVL
jgi:segregation and condensation protein A